MNKSIIWFLLLVLSLCQHASAQEQKKSKTLPKSYYTFSPWRKAYCKREALPPSEGCSFLVGRWTGKTDDGYTIEETWLPVVNETTLGTRKEIKESQLVSCFQLIPGQPSINKKVQALYFDESTAKCETLEGSRFLFCKGEEARFYFEPNSLKIEEILYSLLDKNRISATIIHSGKPRKSFVLNRVKTTSEWSSDDAINNQ